MNERGNGIYVWNSPARWSKATTCAGAATGDLLQRLAQGDLPGTTCSATCGLPSTTCTPTTARCRATSRSATTWALPSLFSDRVVLKDNMSLGDREHGVMLNFANSADVAGNLVRGGTKKCLFIYNAH